MRLLDRMGLVHSPSRFNKARKEMRLMSDDHVRICLAFIAICTFFMLAMDNIRLDEYKKENSTLKKEVVELQRKHDDLIARIDNIEETRQEEVRE